MGRRPHFKVWLHGKYTRTSEASDATERVVQCALQNGAGGSLKLAHMISGFPSDSALQAATSAQSPVGSEAVALLESGHLTAGQNHFLVGSKGAEDSDASEA